MLKLDDDLLLSYVDGELDAETVREVETALATDTEAQRTVETFRKSAALLQTTYNDIVLEPVPTRLTAALLNPQPRKDRQDKPLPARKWFSGWQPFYAMAASLALLAVGFGAGSYVTEMRTEWRDQIARATIDAGPELAPATLPRYSVGESFVFSDGRRETVVKTDGDSVIWRDHYGNSITRYNNFLIPALAWESRTRISKASTNASPGWLWPLALGRDGEFEFRQAISLKGGTPERSAAPTRELQRSWRCSVEQTEKIKVIAGTFDAYKISCFRYRLGSDEWRQTRTYYYAPAVGHYIVREDHYASRPSRRIELVSQGFNSTVLPKTEQIALNKTLQAVLSRNADGVETVWKDASGEIAVTLTPVRTYKDAAGITCREYRSAYDLGKRIRTNFRNVCIGAGGKWKRDFQ